MTEGLTWGVLVVAAFFLWLVTTLLRTHLQLNAVAKVREMLYKERMAAINKGAAVPMESFANFPGTTSLILRVADRLMGTTASRIVGLFGVVLLSLGVGSLFAFRESDVPGWMKLWSLGFIPISLGIGLIVYSLFVKKWK